jgi:hypothetical protein
MERLRSKNALRDWVDLDFACELELKELDTLDL